MRRALDDYRIAGVKTNLNFLTRLVDHPAFAAAELDTHFIEHHQARLFAEEPKAPAHALMFAALYLLLKRQPTPPLSSPWQQALGFVMNEPAQTAFLLTKDDHPHEVVITQHAQGFTVGVGEFSWSVTALLRQDQLLVNIDGHQQSIHVNQAHNTVSVFIKQQRFDFEYNTTVEVASTEDAAGSLKAPMNGTVVAVLVNAGQQVEAGQTLLVMEAMKMEYAIKAPTAGTVNAVFYATGDLVKDGVELVDFAAAAEASA